MDAQPVTVLLIEDNPLDVRLIREMLRRAKDQALLLEPADHLSTGLARLAAGGIDVVLLDLSLPESQGLSTFSQVRDQAPQVPIVVLSGVDDEDVAVEAVRAGAQDYLVKGQVDSNLVARALHYAVERKRAENALRDSEALYRTLIETSPDGIALLDGEGIVLMANQELARMQGCTSVAELQGRSAQEFLTPEQMSGAFEEMSALVGQRRVVRREYRVQRRDGSIYPAEISTAVIHAPRGETRAVVNIVRDITARRRAEEERESLLAAEREQRIMAEALMTENALLYQDLRQRVEELQHTQAQLIQSAKMAAIGQLAAGVAHELNNPLQAVMGFAELLQRNPALGEPEQEDVAIICEEARRARDIVRRLLDFSRQSESCQESANLNAVVRDSLGLLRQRLQALNIVLHEEYDDTLPLLLLDAGQMTQVILNLLNNAIEAMPGGGDLAVRCGQQAGQAVARVWQAGKWAVVSVADTGPGLLPGSEDRIFEPFFSTRPDRTGLGLSVSRGIVEAHDGRIEVESRPGQGCTFSVWLPLAAWGPGQEAGDRSPGDGLPAV